MPRTHHPAYLERLRDENRLLSWITRGPWRKLTAAFGNVYAGDRRGYTGMVFWRAMADEDGHYCFAVAL